MTSTKQHPLIVKLALEAGVDYDDYVALLTAEMIATEKRLANPNFGKEPLDVDLMIYPSDAPSDEDLKEISKFIAQAKRKNTAMNIIKKDMDKRDDDKPSAGIVLPIS